MSRKPFDVPIFLFVPREARAQLRVRLDEERRRRPSLTLPRLIREIVLVALKESR